ncbi:UDP-glucose 6-dehydrogenase [Bacterioplanes sanyensis]|uniref:UDP-glucose dehydrogenase family protein n=1 Tax=Bacterioplanes sanyensis TaxID=1249553 RepID=UPI0016733FF6|nr:UDP-glucose/GDP-mannose dehydrogenase family protein [Bacterioplanes sanyensis]GGY41523.1 UDP-glucose 6-dehydrogenase [Bacterioplanes sanyensis]
MNITVVGTGYVGLVTGACFAEMGNSVACVDIDQDKVERLRQGDIPIYEPGLDAIVANNSKAGRLTFTSELSAAMADAQLHFIAVGTPPGEDGSADLTHVLQVAEEIGRHLNGYAVVVNKSTVPVGTADQVRQVIEEQLRARGRSDVQFDVVSNPEFLKEGAAIEDFMRPDRIVVGVESDHARQIMAELYQSFSRNHDKVMFMGVRDAELTKYAANAMLATKISFMNEIANLAERMGVDIEQVRKGIGSDSRIGYSFIYPGCGYGGSCFPKDVKALIRMGEAFDYSTDVLNAVEARNVAQKRRLFEKLAERLGSELNGATIGIWGLAFKPGTDDMREASSIELINALVAAGAKVRAYDPVAMDEATRYFPAEWLENGTMTLCAHQYDALMDADAMVLVTEWKPFRQPDFNAMRKLLKRPIIIDGRNQYDPHSLKQQGFDYTGIGRDIA